MTQEQLAEAMDTSVVYVSLLENGHTWIKAGQLETLARILGVKPYVLLMPGKK